MTEVGLGQGGAVSRRAVLALVPGLVALCASTARAQRPGGPARIGWLSYISQPDVGLTNLREGLGELGYVEGKSYVLIPRFADGDFTRLPRLVDELMAERIDVLVSRGPSVDYTKPVTARVPVVFAYSGDPVAAGFADSLVAEYKVTEDGARRIGATITRYLARSPRELPTVFDEIRAARPGAMLVFPDSLTLARRQEIVDFVARERIPSMFGWTEFTDVGGLVSYGPSVLPSFKMLAKFVDKVLKGAEAGKVPIEQVSRISLTINMTTARRMGLAVPSSILARADRVIE